MSYISLVFVLLCGVFCSFDVCWATLVGVDVGNAFFKIATVSTRRAFEIVPNAQSERKTPSIVSFAQDTREFGSAALQHATKSPSDVITMIPSLLGFNATGYSLDTSPPMLGHFHPLNWTLNEARGVPTIHLSKRNVTLNPEELASHLFQYIHDMVEGPSMRALKLDAVFTVPEAYGMRQRQALLHAASLANINVLGLIRETPAAALYHAMDLPLNFVGKKLFINVGAWMTQACLVEYGRSTPALLKAGHVKKSPPDVDVLHCEVDTGVGGRQCDLLLAEAMTVMAEASLKEDIRSCPRALQRILRQAERTKIVLSTNKVSNVFIENLYKGSTFRTRIMRDTFERLIEPVLSQGVNVIHRLLQRANETLEGLSGVEVVGGGWRIPAFQQSLSKAIHPHTLGQHVNADEGIVFGATLLAANASSTVRLRPIRFSDGAARGYSVTLRHSTNETGTTRLIVPLGGRMSGFRTLSLKTCDNIEGSLWELHPSGSKQLLETYNITGILEHCQGEYKAFGMPKVSVIFNVNPLGFVTFDRAVAQWEETYLAAVPVTSTSTPATSTEKGSSSAASTTTSTPTSTTTTTTPQTTMVEKTRKHTLRCNTSISERPPVTLSDKGMTVAQASLAEFVRVDDVAARLAKIQNTMEAFVYKSRAALMEDSVENVTDEVMRTEVREKLSQAEDWIYGPEAREAAVETWEESLHKLQDMMEPILYRQSEIEQRQLLASTVEKIKRQIKDVLSPKDTILDTNATVALQQEWDAFEKWYTDVLSLQEKLSLKEQPAYHSADGKRRLLTVSKAIQVVLKTTKPAPQKATPSDGLGATLEIGNSTTSSTLNSQTNETANGNNTQSILPPSISTTSAPPTVTNFVHTKENITSTLSPSPASPRHDEL